MEKNQYLVCDDVRGNIFHSNLPHSNTSFCVVTMSIPVSLIFIVFYFGRKPVQCKFSVADVSVAANRDLLPFHHFPEALFI